MVNNPSWQLWLKYPSIFHSIHDDVIKWKHIPRYWPFVRGIHRSPVNSPHKGQWRAALMFSLTCVWINGWVNNREAGDLIRYRNHYDVIVMSLPSTRHCPGWLRPYASFVVHTAYYVSIVTYHVKGSHKVLHLRGSRLVITYDLFPCLSRRSVCWRYGIWLSCCIYLL